MRKEERQERGRKGRRRAMKDLTHRYLISPYFNKSARHGKRNQVVSFIFLRQFTKKCQRKGQKWLFLADQRPSTVHPLPLTISEYVFLILINPHDMAKEIRKKVSLFDNNSPKKAKTGKKWPFFADQQPPTIHPLPLNIKSEYVYLILINPHDMVKEIRR